MATPSSRQTIIEYSLRQLGSPVIDINVDWQQCEDRLDDALQYFTERHFDGVEKTYFSYQLKQEDLINKYISTEDLPAVAADGPTGKEIVSVVKVFQFGPFTNINMFDVRYQMALTDYFGINRNLTGQGNSQGLASYDSVKRYIKLIEDIFQPEKLVRFSKVTNRIYIDTDWKTEMRAGDYVMFETYAALDPQKYTEIFNDRLLKKYVTALIKRQWGSNMAKFDGVALPGGITLKGSQIYAEAVQEIAAVEQQMMSEYELPVNFMTG
jgi:hypothetical protein